MGEKQVNYLEKIREAFGCADIDVDERVKNVNIHLSVAPSSLPNEAGLRGLISLNAYRLNAASHNILRKSDLLDR